MNHTSGRKVNSSGGKIPPIPICTDLREKLEAEASINDRSPRDQALQILRHYYQLTDYHPNKNWAQDEREQMPDIPLADIDKVLAKLSETSDPFSDDWSEQDNCYHISLTVDDKVFGLSAGDTMYAKLKPPEPGDMIILPCDSEANKVWLGYFISYEGDVVKVQLESEVGHYKGDHPPLVVTKITKREDDDE